MSFYYLYLPISMSKEVMLVFETLGESAPLEKSVAVDATELLVKRFLIFFCMQKKKHKMLL